MKNGDFELKNGAPGGTRTHDPLLRRQMLYPAELPEHNVCAVRSPFRMKSNYAPKIDGNFPADNLLIYHAQGIKSTRFLTKNAF